MLGTFVVHKLFFIISSILAFPSKAASFFYMVACRFASLLVSHISIVFLLSLALSIESLLVSQHAPYAEGSIKIGGAGRFNDGVVVACSFEV